MRTTLVRVGLVVSLIVVIGVPLLFRGEQAEAPADAREIIIITPHNEQIRSEYARAFDAWYFERYNEHISIQWRIPGGTSEIRKMLLAQYAAALEQHEDIDDYVSTVDLFFGGGSFEYNELRKPDKVTVQYRLPDGTTEERSTSVLQRVDFDPAWLEAVYGKNEIGSDVLYDPDQYWFGTALSGFGIVFNNDALAEIGIAQPQSWATLADPRLRGRVAVGNPSFSGSIKKSFDTVLQRARWERGWQILRRLGANARYFALSSLRIPVDVSRGDAAAGVCIDFYGRFEAQAMAEAGAPERVGYIDPAGETAIDADPVAMLRGAPHPVEARRFIEFCVSEEAQALWQFRVDDDRGDGLGPKRYELRRMPVTRVMYEKHFDRFIDQVNPFELARPFDRYDRNYWSFIDTIFTPMVVDNHALLAKAWEAIVEHPAYPKDVSGIVSARDVDDPTLKAMLRLFDAMPEGYDAEGKAWPLIEDTFLVEIKDGWKTPELWHAEADPKRETRLRFARFFRDNYKQILELADRNVDASLADGS